MNFQNVVVCAVAISIAFAVRGATPTSGGLVGTVLDANDVAIPGVTLKLNGPSLPGTRTAQSDQRGRFSFTMLPPGDEYRLEAERSGFATTIRTTVVIPLGADVSLDVAMRPAVADEITVTAAPPLIDVRSAVSSTNITQEQIRAFPTRRDFQQLAVLSPQAVFDRDKLNPAIAGSTHLENDYVIEGMSTRDPLNASSATNLTMDFVDEIQVTTSGLSAEYGRSTGGVVSVLTRSGGNSLTGSLLAYFDRAEWDSNAITSSYRGTDSSDLGHDRQDVGGSLGGPILRDHLWFFLAADPRRDVTPLHLSDTQLGIDRNEQITEHENVFAGKLTSTISPTQSFTVSGFGNPKSRGGWMVGARSDPAAALWTDYSGSRNLTARYSATMSNHLLLEGGLGAHRQTIEAIPNTAEGRTVPYQYDMLTQFRHGGLNFFYRDLSQRDAFLFRTTAMAGTSHEVRFGGDYERNRYERVNAEDDFFFAGQSVAGPDVGMQDVLIRQQYENQGTGSNRNVALFAQDRWEILKNLAITAGVRWETQTLGAAPGVTVATGRHDDGTLIREHRSTFTMDDNWAPRLGVAWDFTGRGRGRLYASAGRYFEAIPLAINVDAFNGFGYTTSTYVSPIQHTSENWYNPAGSPLNGDWKLYSTQHDGYNTYWTDTGPVPIAFDARVPYQDEWSAGAELQFGSSWVAGARVIGRTFKRVLEDHVVMMPGDPYGQEVDAVISNPGESEFSNEFSAPRRSYAAIELMLQRRLTARWQMIASFVSARERGDYDGLYDYANSGSSPNESFQVEYPSWQKYRYGPLRGDRPYQVKLHSSYAAPFGVTLSEGFVYSSGIPISAMTARALYGGARSYYLLPRGSMGRTPDFWNLDLHADWRVPLHLPRHSSVSLIADVFNTTNQHAVLEVDEEYFWRGQADYRQWIAPSNRDEQGRVKFNPNLSASPYYKTATRYQTPRAIQLGLRVAF